MFPIAVELAAGYVSLVPSVSGIEKDLIRDLGVVGDKAGKAFEQQFNDQASKGLKSGSEKNGAEAGKGFTDKFGAIGLGAIGGIAAGFGVAIVGSLISAGTAAGKGLSDAFFEVLDRDRAADRLGASLGLNNEQAGKLGKIAGEIFANNFGESIGEVNQALKTVATNRLLPGLVDDADIAEFTSKLLSITDLFDVELGDASRSIGTLLRTGLAANADEALDIVTRGFQTGADNAGDLLDTLTEYPTQFRKLGLTGEKAMGLISQGLQAGARDSDIVADALKEFSIRAVDGSALTSQSFKQLGIDGAKMAKTIAKGGPEAAEGLDTILDKLRAVKDPVLQAQIAVGLFGTQAEDLGAALFALDPSAAVDTLGQVAGAAASASGQINDNLATSLDGIKRRLDPANLLQAFQTGGFEGVKEQLGIAVNDISAIWDKYGPQVLAGLDAGKAAIAQWWTDHGPEIVASVDAWWDTTGSPALGQVFKDAVSSAWDSAGTLLSDTVKNPETWATIFDIGLDALAAIVNPFSKIGPLIAETLINGLIDAWNAIEIPLPDIKVKIAGRDISILEGATLGTPDIPHVSFHTGGIVPGRPGSEMLALLQAGETVLPTQRMSRADIASMPTTQGGNVFNIEAPSPYRAAQEMVLAVRRQSALRRIA